MYGAFGRNLSSAAVKIFSYITHHRDVFINVLLPMQFAEDKDAIICITLQHNKLISVNFEESNAGLVL